MSFSPLLEGTSDASEDSLWFGRESDSDEGNEAGLLVYFIPGNPCLMSYYERFLTSLAELLNAEHDRDGKRALVGGCSLPGFHLSRPEILQETLPAGLEDQIPNVEELVFQSLQIHCSDRNTGRHTKVILVAHSVGAYMTLELLRRRAQHLNGLQDVEIIGAVLLFPTVTEIAQSQHGRILTVCLPLARHQRLLIVVVRRGFFISHIFRRSLPDLR
jgi:pimeloyl-ACP methyl ester carboxylesterase